MRGVVIQVLFVAAVVALGAFLVHNTLVNLRRQNIATGFGFLDREAAFGIGESLIPYSPADTYARAFLVGLTNTLYVAALGIVLATVFGTRDGAGAAVGQLAGRQAGADLCRDVPQHPAGAAVALLVGAAARGARRRRARRGSRCPTCSSAIAASSFRCRMATRPMAGWCWPRLSSAIAATWVLSRWARRRQARTGRQFPTGWVGLGLILGLPAGGVPRRRARRCASTCRSCAGFNFAGGSGVSPEFAALLLGLVIYTGSFIAEIVRAGILAVSWGQSEAAMALGLTPGQRMRLVVLPQALRVIVPPMTSQYLSLTKNSSLAVIIGYPDLVSIANTTINQTGQAVEGIAMIMAVYLAISLLISLLMNLYNRSVALVER